ncbi:hypothetical protein Taro_010969 [Colocasia esculenta]|uniref:Uncharacterized protein n=1 Tax=Colocasia esculenta TaxID=4460 RepID=A0A843UBA1_COLES|nr:hypothetical protein [Colocasia esculenta]
MYWAPASHVFPVSHFRELGPESLNFTASVLVYGLLELGEFPTEPVTSEAHPYSPQARARRRFRYRLPVQGRAAAVLGQRLQPCSFRSSVVSFFSCTSLPRGSTTPTVVTSPVGCPRFSMSQTVSSGFVPVLVLYRRGARHGPAAVWSAGVVLVGLHCSLALLCGCGAAVGPFVCDCETERIGIS